MLNEPSNYTVVVTSVIGFAALLVQQLVTLYVQHRNHKWDMEERDRRAMEMARQMTFQHKVIGNKIAENTALTVEAKDQAVEAYREAGVAIQAANDTNMKIATLGLAVAAGIATGPAGEKGDKGDKGDAG